MAERRRPLINLSDAQKIWGVDRTTYIRPRFVEEGLCEWCGQKITNKRRTSCCCKECTDKFNMATSPVFYANQGSAGGYRNHMFRRDKYTCQRCGEIHALKNRNGIYLPTTDGLLDLHHVVYVENGGGDEPENLLTLCRDCHKEIHTNK